MIHVETVTYAEGMFFARATHPEALALSLDTKGDVDVIVTDAVGRDLDTARYYVRGFLIGLRAR